MEVANTHAKKLTDKPTKTDLFTTPMKLLKPLRKKERKKKKTQLKKRCPRNLKEKKKNPVAYRYNTTQHKNNKRSGALFHTNKSFGMHTKPSNWKSRLAGPIVRKN